MAISLPTLDSWTERLEAVDDLITIGQAAEYREVAEKRMRLPGAFVLPGEDRPVGTGNASGLIVQDIEQTVGIVIGISHFADPHGERAVGDLATVRNAILQRLLGWIPDNCEKDCRYQGGRLLSITDDALWWLDRYTTRYRIDNYGE